MPAPAPILNPVSAAWNTVARFDDYEGVVTHSATRGKRDFSSVRVLAASHYDLIAREGTVDRARSMLAQAGLIPETSG